jgi:hypothetical protein
MAGERQLTTAVQHVFCILLFVNFYEAMLFSIEDYLLFLCYQLHCCMYPNCPEAEFSVVLITKQYCD